MKRLSICVLITFLCVFISGCSFDMRQLVENNLQERMKKDSGILNDEDYMNAFMLERDGLLDSEGNYIAKIDSEEFETEEIDNEEHSGSVRVSFANNEFISIDFYWDYDHLEKINTDNCFINPGETIYATIEAVNNPYTNCYRFESIRVVEYDSEGKRGNYIGGFEGENNLSFSLTEFYSGTDIVIEPVGKYEKRHIVLNSFWNSSSGEKEVEGTWLVNQNEAIEGSNDIDSSSNYTVIFNYDHLRYYYVSSSPDVFSQKEGQIEFYEESRMGGSEEFLVELYPYTSLKIEDKNKAILRVDVNGSEEKNRDIDSLRQDDKVVVTTKYDYKMKGDINYESVEERDGEYIFTFRIEGTDGKTLNLSTATWDSKTIDIVMDSNNGFVSAWNNFISIFPGTNKEEDSPIVIQAGERKYTYSDLENNKKVVLKENEKLKLTVNEEIIKDTPLKISIDGNEYELSDSSNNELEFSYDEVNTIKIEEE